LNGFNIEKELEEYTERLKQMESIQDEHIEELQDFPILINNQNQHQQNLKH